MEYMEAVASGAGPGHEKHLKQENLQSEIGAVDAKEGETGFQLTKGGVAH